MKLNPYEDEKILTWVLHSFIGFLCNFLAKL